MKVENYKVLLYLKKKRAGQDRQGPDSWDGITLNCTMAQFSCKLSCTPGPYGTRVRAD